MLFVKKDNQIIDTINFNEDLYKLFSYSRISEYNDKTGYEWIPFLIEIINYVNQYGYIYTTESFYKLNENNDFPRMRYLLLRNTIEILNKCVSYSQKKIVFDFFGVPENNGVL